MKVNRIYILYEIFNELMEAFVKGGCNKLNGFSQGKRRKSSIALAATTFLTVP